MAHLALAQLSLIAGEQYSSICVLNILLGKELSSVQVRSGPCFSVSVGFCFFAYHCPPFLPRPPPTPLVLQVLWHGSKRLLAGRLRRVGSAISLIAFHLLSYYRALWLVGACGIE